MSFRSAGDARGAASSSHAEAEPEQGAPCPSERLIDPELRLQHALDVAYRYLSRRERTVRGVRQHLELKRVEPATIDAALEELERSGYLDDAGYAKRFAEDRRNLDAWGAERIERKLQALGIAAEHMRAALAEQDAEGEQDAALAALCRRYPSPLEGPQERERALGYLVRKGYGLDLAYVAIRAHGTDRR